MPQSAPIISPYHDSQWNNHIQKKRPAKKRNSTAKKRPSDTELVKSGSSMYRPDARNYSWNATEGSRVSTSASTHIDRPVQSSPRTPTRQSAPVSSSPQSPSSLRSNSVAFQYVPKSSLSPYQHVQSKVKTQKQSTPSPQARPFSSTMASPASRYNVSPRMAASSASPYSSTYSTSPYSTNALRPRPHSSTGARKSASLLNDSLRRSLVHSSQSSHHNDILFINKNLASIKRREERGKSLVEEKLSARGATPDDNANSVSPEKSSQFFADLLEEIQEDFNSMHLTKHATKKFTTLNSARSMEQQRISPTKSTPNTSAGFLSPPRAHSALSPRHTAETVSSPNDHAGNDSLLSVSPSRMARPLSAKALRSIDLLEKHHFSSGHNRSRKRRRNPASAADDAAEDNADDSYDLESQKVLDENIDQPVLMETPPQKRSTPPAPITVPNPQGFGGIRSPTGPHISANKGTSLTGSPSSPRRFAPHTDILAAGLIDYYENHAQGDKKTDIFKKLQSPSIATSDQGVPSNASTPTGAGRNTPPPLANTPNQANNSSSSLGDVIDASTSAADTAKATTWWKMLAKAIADARPKEDHNIALQKLMKIAIKKKEKEAVKAKQKMERSLVGLYKNKFLFTRRQLRALLSNISRERFSDEVDHQPVSVVQSPYKKRGDPADLLKTLTSRRAQIAAEQQAHAEKQRQARSKRRASAVDVHVKEFIPYTPEKEKLWGGLDSSRVEDDGMALSFSELDTPQSTPQRPTSAKHSRLATHSESRNKRPRSAGTRRSKYRPPAANPASIVLEFQKMVFKNDPTGPRKHRVEHKQRSRIDNGVLHRKKEEKIGVGIMPTSSKA